MVEVVSVVFLWSLNPVSLAQQAVFAILLAIDLISLAMISYVYRSCKQGNQINRVVVIGSCCLILIFVYISLAL